MRYLNLALGAAIVFLISLVSPARSQEPSGEIAELPIQISPERVAALTALSNAARSVRISAVKLRRRVWLYHMFHPLTTHDVEMRQYVRSLGTDKHRFVHCQLKSHEVATGAITSIGPDQFFVATGVFGNKRAILYRDLNAPPRHAAAVGAHLKNGLQISALVGLTVAFSPLLVPYFFLVTTGIVQD